MPISRISRSPVPRLPWRACAFALLALAFAALAAERASGDRPAVVLISLDGTTPQAVESARIDAIDTLTRRGVAARRLTPAFPTNTFPNHVTLVTGVAPEVHGIVNSAFLDPERGLFDKSGDPGWIEVEPIWSIAARHGVVSASFHWVGSEGPWRTGRGPRHWKRFDASTGEMEKVEQILTWLDEPAPQRPRLVTAWFHGADREAHRHGPDSPQVRRALREQGLALARLVEGLDAGGALATTTLLLVSDHGMASVERRVDLDRTLREAGVAARRFGAGGFSSLVISGGPEAERRAVEVARRAGLEAHRRVEAPPDLRVAHERFGDVVVIAPVGTSIERGGALRPRMRGAHGYRPGEPAMGAFFVAGGRVARPGARLREVRAVDVAPSVLALLEIPVPEWMEGSPIPELVEQGGARSPARARSAR